MEPVAPKLLVAVDGSPAASAAIDAALDLASAMGAPVLFVHAASPLAEDLFAEGSNDDAPTADTIAARDPVLADARGRAGERGVEADVHLVAHEGHSPDLAAQISGIAAGSGATMIVTGSRGRGALAGAVLGSVSHNLIKHATVPVLVVHAPDQEA
jgi:nucleotide-binding universal stress UspA family protein